MKSFIFSTPLSVGLVSSSSGIGLLLKGKLPECGVVAELGRVLGATRFHTVTRFDEYLLERDTPQISSSTYKFEKYKGGTLRERFC